jgi:PhoH-like ATPase
VLVLNYTGFRKVTNEELAAHYENDDDNILELNPNEFIITEDNTILKYKESSLVLAAKRTLQSHYMGKVKPKNIEQAMAVDLLLDNEIKCVVLTGAAGCGKTFLAAQAGIFQIEKKNYDKIFFTRNHVEIGKPLGALPGDVYEKIKPYCASIVDQIGGWNVMFDLVEEKRIVDVEAISFLQGRDLKKCFIIVDEAQNINKEQVKMLVTRVGEDSKIVFCGDLEQIANGGFKNGNNGLEHLIHKFSGITNLYGMVELQESVRSELAKLAAKIL